MTTCSRGRCATVTLRAKSPHPTSIQKFFNAHTVTGERADLRSMTYGQMQDVVSRIKHPLFQFSVVQRGSDPYLQVSFLAMDHMSQAEGIMKGRKWLLSSHMTPSEIVQTALKAVLTAMEHEAREDFTYRSRAIFAPHFDVEQLVELVDSGHTDRRPPTALSMAA